MGEREEVQVELPSYNEIEKKVEKKKWNKKRDLLYTVNETPPWYLCILLGFQHYLTAFGSTISVPLVLYKALCVGDDKVGLSEVISTIFFVSGVCTLLQTTIGTRLPIIQGATFAFLTPTFSILALPQWKCPYELAESKNWTIGVDPEVPSYGSPEHKEIWHTRMREIQGAIIVASLAQVVIGYSGLLGMILQFIGPLAIAPTITLISLSLFPAASDLASKQWYIALMTMFLIALFSQYMKNIEIPVCKYEKGKGCGTYKLPIFKLFPIFLALLLSWAVCGILTGVGAFTDNEKGWGYNARTDTKLYVINDAKWFRFPYPGQWGLPTVSVAGVFGMLAGVLASMIESVGDYYACARLAGAPPPPVHAVNRGIGTEGLACILAGALGSGNGTTSYSENIGAIGITKVGSVRVVQVGGLIMIILGCLGKFGALFVTIPDPVIGGLFMIVFGMVTAVGLSNLQYVDLTSSRNIFILGTSLFFGLSCPAWFRANPNAVDTGSDIADQILSVLLGTSMFIGGIVGFVLDNTIPGTPEERGILKWRSNVAQDAEDTSSTPDLSMYDIPLIQKYLDKVSVFKYVPFCPRYKPVDCCSCRKTGNRKREHTKEENLAYDAATDVQFEKQDSRL